MTNDFKDEGEEHLRQQVKESCATDTKMGIHYEKNLECYIDSFAE